MAAAALAPVAVAAIESAVQTGVQFMIDNAPTIAADLKVAVADVIASAQNLGAVLLAPPPPVDEQAAIDAQIDLARTPLAGSPVKP